MIIIQYNSVSLGTSDGSLRYTAAKEFVSAKYQSSYNLIKLKLLHLLMKFPRSTKPE